MSSLNYPPVARMNATRTTPPYHPVQVEEEQKSTTNLEYGTRYMEKQPFVKPALAEIEPKFNSDMRKLVK